MGWNIFVYGTLKKGEPNHWLIKKLKNHARFLSLAKTRDKLPLVIGEHNCPVLIDQPGKGHHIPGQVYVVDGNAIEVLDAFESCLTRKRVDVVLLNKFLTSHSGDQDSLDCYCYMTDKSFDICVSDYSSLEHQYNQEQAKRDLEAGSALIVKFIGDERLRNVTGRRDFTDDSSDRQNSSETTD